MNEYISKQRAKDLMGCCLASAKANLKVETSIFKKAEFEIIIKTIESMIDVVGAVEVADVQPVIHSRWIPTGDGTYNAYCENCGQERGSKSWNKNDFKYCFGCGARMIKDGDAE